MSKANLEAVNVLFLSFSFRFMMVIKQAVERLDYLEVSYSPALLYVGARHQENKQFCIENFWLFKDSILYIWRQVLREKFTAKTEEEWISLLDFIIAGLTAGFRH